MKLHAPDLSAICGIQISKDGCYTVPNHAPTGSRRGNEADHRTPIPENSASSRRRLRGGAPLGLHPRTRWNASLLMLVVSCLLACLSVSARTIHVSPSGNDANSGTAAQPYKTIGRAVTNAVNGDSIIVTAGSYPAQFITSKRITFQSIGGSAVIHPPQPVEPPSLDADAGEDTSIAAGLGLYMDGAYMLNDSWTDEEVEVSWRAIGDPVSVAIEDPGELGTFVRFQSVGVFTLRLTVRALGMTATDDVVVTVQQGTNIITDPQPSRFSVSASAADPTLTGTCDCNRTPSFLATAQLRGTVHNAGNSPVYQWQQMSGPPSVEFANRFAKDTAVHLREPGCYTFQLTVRSNGTPVSMTSEVKVSAQARDAKDYIKFMAGPMCQQTSGGFAIQKSSLYITNEHSCASIAYTARILYLSPSSGGFTVLNVSGTLNPGEGRYVNCENASGKILTARYVSGCGAGSSDGCVDTLAFRDDAEPALLMMRADDGTPAVVVDPAPFRRHTVEATSDLRQWSAVTNFTAGTDPYLIHDSQAGTNRARFYRVRMD